MDDIYKELWSALKALSGEQWVVLLTIAFIFGCALFLAFRWLYNSRFEAQGSLIDLKDKVIEQYKSAHAEGSRIKPLSEIAPQSWEPFLDQAYQQLEELLQHSEKQQTMNYTCANMGFIRDAELYVLYLQSILMLSQDQASDFKREQELWLNERKIYCEGSVQSHGGSLASLEYSSAFIEYTEARIEELRRRFNRFGLGSHYGLTR